MMEPIIKKQKITKTDLARSLGVSRQSLYYQPILPAKDMIVKKQIKEVLSRHPSYGHKRIALTLKTNKKRILRIMKKFSLKPYRRRIKKRPIKLEDIDKPIAVYKNEIINIYPDRPNVVWAGDFTYLRFHSRFIYFATIVDLFNREILGFALSVNHDRFLVLKALEMAVSRAGTFPIYHHSDQGSEYDSYDYLKQLKENKVIVSMSGKGHPWENGYQEAFYSQFKLDLGWIDRFETLGELMEAVLLQIHYYNTDRIHTSLKMSPLNFREQFNLKSLSLTLPQGQRQLV